MRTEHSIDARADRCRSRDVGIEAGHGHGLTLSGLLGGRPRHRTDPEGGRVPRRATGHTRVMSFAPRRAIVTASESGIEPPVATGVGVGMVAGDADAGASSPARATGCIASRLVPR